MGIPIKYQLVHQRFIFWWKNDNVQGVSDYECIDHSFHKTTTTVNYMGYDGAEQYDEHWLECYNCDRVFTLGGEEV